MNYFDVANSRLLYVLVGIGLLYISGLVVVFMRKAWRRALELGIPKKTILEVVKSSAVFTVIPSISVIIGLFSLSAVLGVPWSWFRLSVVGAVSYELTAAEMVSDALGFQSAGAMAAANNYQVFGAIMFVTSIGEHDEIQKKQGRLGSCFQFFICRGPGRCFYPLHHSGRFRGDRSADRKRLRVGCHVLYCGKIQNTVAWQFYHVSGSHHGYDRCGHGHQYSGIKEN